MIKSKPSKLVFFLFIFLVVSITIILINSTLFRNIKHQIDCRSRFSGNVEMFLRLAEVSNYEESLRYVAVKTSSTVTVDYYLFIEFENEYVIYRTDLTNNEVDKTRIPFDEGASLMNLIFMDVELNENYFPKENYDSSNMSLSFSNCNIIKVKSKEFEDTFQYYNYMHIDNVDFENTFNFNPTSSKNVFVEINNGVSKYLFKIIELEMPISNYTGASVMKKLKRREMSLIEKLQYNHWYDPFFELKQKNK